MDRASLDRRRLEEAHIRFCILDIFQKYPAAFPHRSIATNLQESLDVITPVYYEAFAAKYAG